MLVTHGMRFLFIGDSITDCARLTTSPVLGNGYVYIVNALIRAKYPELGLDVVNRGVSGNTVRDLEDRWQRDVVDWNPDWLSIMIGVNDGWRRRSHDVSPVSIEAFSLSYRRLLDRVTSELGTRLVLAEPFLIEPDEADPARRAIEAYGKVVGQLADEYGARLVRTQTVFDSLMANGTNPSPVQLGVAGAEWALDRVHPNFSGHAAIALAILELLEW